MSYHSEKISEILQEFQAAYKKVQKRCVCIKSLGKEGNVGARRVFRASKGKGACTAYCGENRAKGTRREGKVKRETKDWGGSVSEGCESKEVEVK